MHEQMQKVQTVEPETPQSCETWEGEKSMHRVRELHELGVSVTRIAERFGVSRETISRWLNGQLPVKQEAPADTEAPTSPETGSSKASIAQVSATSSASDTKEKTPE